MYFMYCIMYHVFHVKMYFIIIYFKFPFQQRSYKL